MRFRPFHPILVVLVFSLSCEESLPPRQDPTDLFKVQLSSTYLYTQLSNSVIVNVTAINQFDETISDHADISGSIIVTSARDSSVHKTYPVSSANLIHGDYDAIKGILTINPGDSVVFQIYWDFTDDNGESLADNFFHYSVDRTCQQRMIAQLETFEIAAKAKLYSNLGYAQSQIPFSIVQFDHFVGPHDCLPL